VVCSWNKRKHLAGCIILLSTVTFVFMYEFSQQQICTIHCLVKENIFWQKSNYEIFHSVHCVQPVVVIGTGYYKWCTDPGLLLGSVQQHIIHFFVKHKK
jgi:hypothetical protein